MTLAFKPSGSKAERSPTRLADEMAELRAAMIRNVAKGDTPRGTFRAAYNAARERARINDETLEG